LWLVYYILQFKKIKKTIHILEIKAYYQTSGYLDDDNLDVETDVAYNFLIILISSSDNNA
jgi:hypothetical protein